jgi:hypothetical protein
MRRIGLALTASALLAVIIAGPAGAQSPPYSVIAGGLHNPRGLTFGPGGRLYVAEAGTGTGSGTPRVGFDGAIHEIQNPGSATPAMRTIIGGLLSLSSPEGDVVGVDGISACGNGAIYAIMAESKAATGQAGAGRLLKVTAGGQAKTIVNVGAADYAWSQANKNLVPDQFPDANPYGVLALAGREYVVDAASNTLDVVLANGTLQILAFFPNASISDAVPTCVAKGPDGALYIGTLALVDSFVNGPSAKVYRLDPATLSSGRVKMVGPADEWATGLEPINDCAFGANGALYVSELFTSVTFGPHGPQPSGGDVIKLPFASPATHTSLTGGSLPLAGGVAVSSDGTVYAVGLTAFAPTGFVARLDNH